MDQLQLMRKKMLMKKKNQPNSESKISNPEQPSNQINQQINVTPFQNHQRPLAQQDQQEDAPNQQLSQQKGGQAQKYEDNDPEKQKKMDTPELVLNSLDEMRKKLLNVKKTQTKIVTPNIAEEGEANNNQEAINNQYRQNQILSNQSADIPGQKQRIIKEDYKERIQSLQIPKAACIRIHDKKLAKNNKILLKQLSKLQSNIITLNKLLGNQCQGHSSNNLSLRGSMREASQENDIPVLSQKVQEQIKLMVGFSNKINTMIEESQVPI